MHSQLYPKPLAEIVIEEEAVRSVFCEYSEARGEPNDEEEKIDVVGGGEAGVRSCTESEGFDFVDAPGGASLIAESDP